MEPIAILLVLPVLIGVAAERYFRDVKNASLAAALGSALVVALCVKALDPDGNWSLLAAMMVSPLPIAFAAGAVLICHGRSEARARKQRKRGRGDA